MVPLLLGDRTHAVHKVQGRLEIGECISFRQMVPAHHLPASHLRLHSLQFLAFERRDATPARHALLFGQTHYGPPFLEWKLRQRAQAGVEPRGFTLRNHH